MHGQAGNHGVYKHPVTRRDVLKTGLTTGLGLGTTALLGATSLPRTAAAAPVYGGHLTVLNAGYPEVWDPHIAGTLLALAATSPVYNQIVEFNPLNHTEIIGDLAKHWEVTEGGLAYVFHLHDNVKWWDGKDLTAEDVAFSLQRMIEPGKPRPRTGLLRPYIQAVEVLDRNTVKVTLYYPSPAFLQFLAVDYMKILPKHLLQAGVDINVWENIVGSGPFKIKTARRGDSVTYERNPTYFKKGRPYVDGLTILAITDAGTAAAAIRAGRIHMTTGATALGVDDLLKLEKELQGKYSLYWQPNVTDVWHVFGNVEREPWNDPRMIKALRLATDQRELQQGIGAGRWDIGAPFPIGSWYGSTREDLFKLPGYRTPKAQDIAEAKALLKAAGYDPPSKLGKRVLNVGTVSVLPDTAQLWAAQMRRNLGLELELRVRDAPTAIHAHTAGDYDLGIWGYAYNIDDPDDYVNAIYGPGARNYTRWKHPKFLEMLAQQSREVDREKRWQLLRKMEEFLQTVEDPYIQILWKPWTYLVSDKVRTEAGPFVTPPSLQTVHKNEHLWLQK
jgi:peptide/nickel transport system substrate-binding protein